VILNTANNEYTSFGGPLGNQSVAHCEAWAIWSGLLKTKEIIESRPDNKLCRVLLISDSKLNVLALSKYLSSWDISDWKHWKKHNSEDQVKNQDLYRRILELVFNCERMKLKVTHINSHLKEDDWQTIQAKLSKFGVTADENTSKLCLKMNALADSIASDISWDLRSTDDPEMFMQLVPRRPSSK